MSLSVINKMYILVTKCTNGPETVTSHAENPEITCVRQGGRTHVNSLQLENHEH